MGVDSLSGILQVPDMKRRLCYSRLETNIAQVGLFFR
jgi:hypothetical protein